MAKRKKIVLGVTGIFGSGKTTVSAMFAKFGAELMDADRIAHRLIAPGNPAYRRIVEVFGSSILDNRRQIDRKKLAKIVFSRRPLLDKLNTIVHPRVIKFIKDKVKLSKADVIVLDVPLLIESGLSSLPDKVIVVKASAREISKRLSRGRFVESDISRRHKAQLSLRKKIPIADFIIDNSAAKKSTLAQVKRAWNIITNKRGQK